MLWIPVVDEMGGLRRQSYSQWQNRIMWRSICNHFMPREKTDVEERWWRGGRGMGDEEGGVGVGDVEGRCGRNSRVARTLKLVCHSVRQSAYSQTQTQVAHSICANVSIFTHTQEAHKKHSFSLHQHKLEEGNILFFVLCHRLIRFHHHSNAFPLSTVFSSFLTSLTLSATL